MNLKKVAIGLSALNFIFTGQAVGAQAGQPSCDALVEQAESLAKQGHWQKAQDVLNQACLVEPANVQALHDLAVTYAHTSDLSRAAECEQKALVIDEKYVPSHIELAYLLGKQEDKTGAQEHLTRALELDPNNKAALKNLQTLLNTARFRRTTASASVPAAGLTQTRITETPVSQALVCRGAGMFRQGKYEIARRLYEQALENCPDSVAAHASLGVICGTGGDIEGQIKEERLALSVQPKDAVALCNLGWALSQKGELDESLLSYQKALALNPSLLEAQAGQGILLYRTGKFEAGLAVLKEFVRQNPEQPLLHLSLAVVLQGTDRNDESLAEYQEAWRLAPNNLEIKTRLAACYLTCEKFAKAAELYSQLVERNPANPELRIGLGLSLTKTNDIKAASQQFKKAAEIQPSSAAAHACLSMIEEVKGCLVQAENYARLAQQKDPDSKFLKESADRLARSRKQSEM